jgi:threonylcarbamoyladenosine tRNA methylthiotransferase CDKAL1
MTSVYVETYGCTLNQSESEELTLQLIGHRVVESTEDARVLVLNTCMVIATTEKKILRRIDTLYQQLGARTLIITGCMAGPFGDRLHALYPALKTMRISGVASYIDAHFSRGAASAPRPNITAKVKIAQGCGGSCSYCIVKLIRGPVKSRSIEAITRDVEQRVQNGAKQIFLTAQDGGVYGLDQGHRLPDLVEALCEIEHDFKLRVGMMNVSSILDIAEDLVETFKHPRVYRFVHLPVQSGSDRILELMERGHTVSDFKHVVSSFRHELRDVTVSTDFIVGFPSETSEDFRATVDLLREVAPLKVNITRFSQREGTKAFFLRPVTGRIQKDRSRTLTAEHHRVARQRNCECIGESYRALAVERGKKGGTVLYNDNYRPIVVLRELPLGLFYAVRITGVTSTYLIGSLN